MVSTEALPVLLCVLLVDLKVQRRAAMYFSTLENMECNFCEFSQIRDRDKIIRLLQQQSNVYNNLRDEWQQRWNKSSKGRLLYHIRERLSRI